MHICGLKGEPGYAQYERLVTSGMTHLRVYLDGMEMSGVIEADEEHGVVVSVDDPDGKRWVIGCTADGEQQYRMYEYRGKVEIRPTFYFGTR